MALSISGVARRNATRRLERGLAVGAFAALLARQPSLVPRERNDEALIVSGAGALGLVAGVATDAVVCRLGRRLPGGRTGAGALLGGLGVGFGSRHGDANSAT